MYYTTNHFNNSCLYTRTVVVYCCYGISGHGATGNGNGGLSRDVSTNFSAEMPLNLNINGSRAEQDNFIIPSDNDKTSAIDLHENCLSTRSKEFSSCAEKIGENSMKHFATRNMTEMLSDLCR